MLIEPLEVLAPDEVEGVVAAVQLFELADHGEIQLVLVAESLNLSLDEKGCPKTTPHAHKLMASLEVYSASVERPGALAAGVGEGVEAMV